MYIHSSFTLQLLSQAQLKLADHLRKMAEQGRDLEGMDVDLDELRRNLNKLKKGRFGAFLGDFDFQVRRRLTFGLGKPNIDPFYLEPADHDLCVSPGPGRLDQQQAQGQGRHDIFLRDLVVAGARDREEQDFFAFLPHFFVLTIIV